MRKSNERVKIELSRVRAYAHYRKFLLFAVTSVTLLLEVVISECFMYILGTMFAL